MHELSIAASIVDAVAESVAAYPGARVTLVRMRVGALAAVVEDSLQFCWQIATQDTPLAGAALLVRTLPVVVHCAACNADSTLAGLQSFRCLLCSRPAPDLRQGRELEIESIELEEPEIPAPEIHAPQAQAAAHGAPPIALRAGVEDRL
jgi:hydrogenase nickel incorporation protein HypA/HybF